MDFDDLDVPSQATSRVSKFAPKSSKLKPKKEPELVPKLEPQQIDLTSKRNFETIAPTQTKVEPNNIVKIDVESNSEVKEDSRNVDSTDVEMIEAEEDSIQVNPINEDNEEDTIVREIDVFFSPSINDNTKVCYCFCLLDNGFHILPWQSNLFILLSFSCTFCNIL
jgi:DNA-directed RNA polymerase-3 subunit RPC5